MKKRGKKTLAWDTTRAKLKVRFERAGIVSCEIRIDNKCTGRMYLSFAHSLKRRNITTQAELEEVALCCLSCHRTIESMKHDQMKSIVIDAICERETQL